MGLDLDDLLLKRANPGDLPLNGLHSVVHPASLYQAADHGEEDSPKETGVEVGSSLVAHKVEEGFQHSLGVPNHR